MNSGARMNWNTWFSSMTKRGLVFALMLVAAAAYYVRMLKGFPAPVVVPDEFGYSVIAAYLAGHDWSNVAQGVPWYSYGYSLLLAPIYMLVKPTGWYHAAQFMNVVLVIVAGILANAFLKRFVTDKVDRYMAVAAVLLYPSLVLYVHFTWSESLIVILPWAVAIQTARMARASSGYLDSVIFAVLLACCYYVHSRLIVICIAGLMVLGYQVLANGRKWRALVCFAVFVVVMGLGALLKNYFIAHVYHGNVGGDQDSVVRMALQVVKRLDDPAALLTLLAGAAGQFAYLLIATLGLLIPGVFYMATQARSRHVQGDVSAASALIFLLLALMGSYALIAITMGSSPQHPHHIFYGRYTDPLVLPAMAFGLVYCMRNRRIVFRMALVSLVLAFLTVPLAMSVAAKLPGPTHWGSLAGLFPYRANGWYLYTHHILVCFSLVVVSLAIVFRLSPRLAGTLVCLALLLAGIDITRAHQAGSSENAFNWRARLSQPAKPYRGVIVFDASEGDQYYQRTQVRIVNPDATIFIVGKNGPQANYREFEDHLVAKRDEKGVQHLNCEFDESAKVPQPAVCQNISSGPFKISAQFTMGDPRKKLAFSHAWMGARLYRFISTLPYLRTMWPYLGTHRVTLRYVTHAKFSTAAVLTAFVTRAGTPAWMGEHPARLLVPEGDATGLVKVPVTTRGYDGKPLPPGPYLFHVVVTYPDGHDWSTMVTIPMSIR